MANFNETRDNATNIETAIMAADAFEDTREISTDPFSACFPECECPACVGS